jgi:hypothetical protein
MRVLKFLACALIAGGALADPPRFSAELYRNALSKGVAPDLETKKVLTQVRNPKRKAWSGRNGGHYLSKIVSLQEGLLLDVNISDDINRRCFSIVLKSETQRFAFEHTSWCIDEQSGSYRYSGNGQDALVQVKFGSKADQNEIVRLTFESDVVLPVDANTLVAGIDQVLIIRQGQVLVLDP